MEILVLNKEEMEAILLNLGQGQCQEQLQIFLPERTVQSLP